MAVRIRMKKMGRRHRPYFRICVMDGRVPRDGRVLEEVGTYDPMLPETDARAVLDGERIAYWVGVGAQPSEKVAVLIKKYGQDGTRLEQQKEALARVAATRCRPEIMEAPAPVKKEKKAEAKEEAPAEESKPEETAEAPKAEAPAEETKPEAEETPSEE